MILKGGGFFVAFLPNQGMGEKPSQFPIYKGFDFFFQGVFFKKKFFSGGGDRWKRNGIEREKAQFKYREEICIRFHFTLPSPKRVWFKKKKISGHFCWFRAFFLEFLACFGDVKLGGEKNYFDWKILIRKKNCPEDFVFYGN